MGVAPFTGAWIETIVPPLVLYIIHNVAPFTGAWIETSVGFGRFFKASVAPFTGAWIETILQPYGSSVRIRRPLHGGVD